MQKLISKDLTPRWWVWVVGNIAAAVALPLAFGWWLDRQVRASDAALPEDFAPSTVVVTVAVAWCLFLLLLNVTLAVFLWLKRR